MAFIYKLNLQLFGGEGAAGDGGAGGATGEGSAQSAAAPAAEEQRLRELGVPEAVLNKRANRKSAKQREKAVSAQTAEPAAEQTEEPQAAAAQTQTEEAKTDTAPRMTWAEIMADPEYNKEMQATMQKRLRDSKAAQENLAKLTPALEVLTKKYGMDMNNVDYDALAQAISNDDSHYEEEALTRGKTVAETKQEILQEVAAKQKRTLEQQMFRAHFDGLVRQGAELKKTFPSFDLQKELQDDRFRRMTSPSGGLSVEDAYYAIHRREIDAARNQLVAQETEKRMSNAIRSNQRRPTENGTSGQAPSVTHFDYRKATKDEREAFKRRINSGEKIYPGQR